MKSLITALVSLVSVGAMACPGGGMKSLEYNGKTVAVIDMVKNRLRILDKKAELAQAVYRLEGAEDQVTICDYNEDETACTSDMEIPIDLTSNPTAHVWAQINIGQNEVAFDATDFRVMRSMCGGVVEGEEL